RPPAARPGRPLFGRGLAGPPPAGARRDPLGAAHRHGQARDDARAGARGRGVRRRPRVRRRSLRPLDRRSVGRLARARLRRRGARRRAAALGLAAPGRRRAPAGRRDARARRGARRRSAAGPSPSGGTGATRSDGPRGRGHRPEGALTYGELWALSGRLAAHLTGHLTGDRAASGAGREGRVAICLPRGPGLVAAELAALRAGAAFVPLDPAQPAERIALLLEGADAAVAVISRA